MGGSGGQSLGSLGAAGQTISSDRNCSVMQPVMKFVKWTKSERPIGA